MPKWEHSILQEARTSQLPQGSPTPTSLIALPKAFAGLSGGSDQAAAFHWFETINQQQGLLQSD